jgi:hypothetical protein
LRYALTGGDRAVDTADTTILQRAYLYNGWNLHNGTYFPSKRFPQAMVGRVIPPFIANGLRRLRRRLSRTRSGSAPRRHPSRATPLAPPRRAA